MFFWRSNERRLEAASWPTKSTARSLARDQFSFHWHTKTLNAWDVRTQKGLLRNQLIDSSSSQWSEFPHWIIINPIHLSQVAGITIIAVLCCYVFYVYFFCYCAIKLRIIISRKKSSLYDILNKKQDERDSGQKIVKKFLLCYLSFDFLLLLEVSLNLAGDICDFSHSISY